VSAASFSLTAALAASPTLEWHRMAHDRIDLDWVQRRFFTGQRRFEQSRAAMARTLLN
jgi:hypothetical protein